jgi:hypothetical protein
MVGRDPDEAHRVATPLGLLFERFHRFHAWLLVASAGVVALAIGAVLCGIDMAGCLVVLMLAPAVTVVGYEVLGYRQT